MMKLYTIIRHTSNCLRYLKHNSKKGMCMYKVLLMKKNTIKIIF